MTLTAQLAVFLAATVIAVPLFRRFRLSAVLGYLAAGVVIGPWGLGLLRSAPALGALAVALWLSRRPLDRRVGPMLFGAVALFGAATMTFGLSTSLPLSLAALAVLGAADMVSVVIRMSIVQLETPDEMRGRVGAVTSVFIGASNQIGEFESGLAAAWLGPVAAVIVGGLGTLVVVGLWVGLFPALARRDRLSPTHQGPISG